MSSSFPTSASSGIGLALVIALILLASNFTVIDAQQQGQLASQPEELGNGITTPSATIFQSTNDSFRIQVPDGWIAHDINNSTAAMSEEITLGYGLLAQLCSQEEQQQGAGGISTNTSGSTSNSNTSNNNSCQGVQEEVIHIIRYPDLDTRLLANNVTSINNNNTTITDNIISYQLQKLQEVGYRSMRIVTTTNMTVNLTNPLTNETVTTLPAKFVEITYETNFAPNEIRRGYFVAAATNATTPNPGDIKGYSVFYEGNSTATNATTTTTAIVTPASTSLPAPTQVAQVFDSFELLLAPELVQLLALQTAQSAEAAADTTDDEEDAEAEDEDDDGDGGDSSCHPSYPDTCIAPPPPNLNCDDVSDTNFEVVASDPHGFDGDNDGIGCESGSGAGVPDDDDGGDDDEGDLDDCTVVGGTSPSDDCDMTLDDNGGGDIDGGDDDGGDEGEGNEGEDNPNEFDDCIVTPGRDPGDDGC